MRPFGHPSGTLRGIAALVSLALTAGIFLLLRATSMPPAPKRAERQVAVAIITPLPPPRVRPAPAPAPVEAAPARNGVRRAAPPPRPVAPGPAKDAQPEAITPDLAAAPPSPAEPASAPLRLDARTIGRAIAASEGNIRQMARRSGAELDSPRASRSEALADTVAEKGVPDCLAPNGGGSLLSVPILLVLAMQGKCK